MSDISGNLVTAEREGCNSLKIQIQISPSIPFLSIADLDQLIKIDHENISIASQSYKEGVFFISADYDGDIT